MRKSERVLAGKMGRYRKERWRHRKKRERERIHLLHISLFLFQKIARRSFF